MKTCEKCGRKLSAAAKCADSALCTTCASSRGGVQPIGIPLFPMNNRDDWYSMIDRLNT
jgi:hypothetical protein